MGIRWDAGRLVAAGAGQARNMHVLRVRLSYCTVFLQHIFSVRCALEWMSVLQMECLFLGDRENEAVFGIRIRVL